MINGGIVNKGLVYLVSGALVLAVWPRRVASGTGFQGGHPTANEAARADIVLHPPRVTPSPGEGESTLRNGWVAGLSDPDTTGYDFPEENEDETKRIIRDVAVFLIVSAFVAFFIIKVFIEEDEEPVEEPPPPKPIPTSISTDLYSGSPADFSK